MADGDVQLALPPGTAGDGNSDSAVLEIYYSGVSVQLAILIFSLSWRNLSMAGYYTGSWSRMFLRVVPLNLKELAAERLRIMELVLNFISCAGRLGELWLVTEEKALGRPWSPSSA